MASRLAVLALLCCVTAVMSAGLQLPPAGVMGFNENMKESSAMKLRYLSRRL